MEFLEDFIIPVVAIVAVFGTLFGGFYFWITRRHAERLALIDRGMGDALAPNPRASLRAAWVALGVGLGVLAGWLLVQIAGAPPAVAYGSGICSGFGVGLLVYLRAAGSKEAE
jgi:hypothetical protein